LIRCGRARRQRNFHIVKCGRQRNSSGIRQHGSFSQKLCKVIAEIAYSSQFVNHKAELASRLRAASLFPFDSTMNELSSGRGAGDWLPSLLHSASAP
jgi:hypothetical protein